VQDCVYRPAVNAAADAASASEASAARLSTAARAVSALTFRRATVATKAYGVMAGAMGPNDAAALGRAMRSAALRRIWVSVSSPRILLWGSASLGSAVRAVFCDGEGAGTTAAREVGHAPLSEVQGLVDERFLKANIPENAAAASGGERG